MSGHAIGIDIGGSAVKLGLVGERGEILVRRRLGVEKRQDFAVFASRLSAAVEDLRGHVAADTVAIGLAMPGFVEPATGISIDGMHNVPALERRSLPAELSRATGLPVVAQNDGIAATKGELLFGAGRSLSRFLMMTIGTGIGGGLVIDRGIVTGTRGEPPELGAIVLDRAGPVNYSNLPGTLEAYASVSGLNDAYGSENLSAEEIFRRAREGDVEADRAVDVVCGRLAQACGMLVNALNLEACILGGGVSNAGEALRARVESHLPRYTWPMLLGNCTVRLAQHRNDAGILGAAAFAAGWTGETVCASNEARAQAAFSSRTGS